MRSSKVTAPALAAALVLSGLATMPAAAQPIDSMIAGTLGVGWSDDVTSKAPARDWLANGSAVLTIDDPGLNVQVNFNNNVLEVPRSGSTGSQSNDQWSYGGDVFWRDYAGNTGINVNFAGSTSSGTAALKSATSSYASYGWFGQWFALPELTAELKAGRFEDHLEGWYGDGGIIYYPYSEIALSFTADYAHAQHIQHELKDGGFEAEFMPVREVPVSMYLGYDFAEYSQFDHHHTNIFLVGLKVYLGGGGREGTLRDYQRNGTANWDGLPPTFAGLSY